MNVSNAMPMKHELIQQVIGTFVYQSNSDIRNNRNNYLFCTSICSLSSTVISSVTGAVGQFIVMMIDSTLPADNLRQ